MTANRDNQNEYESHIRFEPGPYSDSYMVTYLCLQKAKSMEGKKLCTARHITNRLFEINVLDILYGLAFRQRRDLIHKVPRSKWTQKHIEF